jgi:ligand-binding sensor domain-containing protein
MRIPAPGPVIRRYGRPALALATVIALASGATALWRARTALKETAARIEAQRSIAFRAARLGRALPPGVETLATPASFRDAAVYRGLLWVAGPTGLYAFDPATGMETKRYRPGIELPPVPLTAIAAGAASDSPGPELWIGTAGDGLLAFDGAVFRSIRPDDPQYRKVTALAPLSTGRIVFGTEKAGLLVYDGHTIAPFHDALAAGHVTAVAGDDSALWVGTLDRGLLYWHSGAVDTFTQASGLAGAQVLSLAVPDNGAPGRAWAGTPTGVAEFTGGKFSRTLAPGVVAQSLGVSAGHLLIGTLDEGILEVPLETSRPRPGRAADAMTGPESVSRIIPYGDQMLAVSPAGVFAAGAGRHDWKRVTAPAPAAMLADRNISALSAGSGGRLWIGYFDRGVDVLDEGGRIAHTENDRVFCVNRIVEDPGRGVTAVATANGLVMFDASGRERQVLTRADGLIADYVADVLVRRGGGLAVATSAGVTLIDSSGMRSLYAFHGLVNNHAYTLAAANGTLLVGTLGGLSVLDPAGAIKASYTTSNSRLKHNWITAIVPEGAGAGDWMVGTYGAGVLRLDAAGNWRTFDDLKPDFVVNPNAMLATGKAIYAGTLDGGLRVWRRDTARWSRVADGFPSLNITALAARGNAIYIGTDNGLVRRTEEDLLER